MVIFVRYLGFAVLSWLIGVAIRSKQDADSWGMDFWEVFQDKLMRILGVWK